MRTIWTLNYCECSYNFLFVLLENNLSIELAYNRKTIKAFSVYQVITNTERCQLSTFMTRRMFLQPSKIESVQLRTKPICLQSLESYKNPFRSTLHRFRQRTDTNRNFIIPYVDSRTRLMVPLYVCVLCSQTFRQSVPLKERDFKLYVETIIGKYLTCVNWNPFSIQLKRICLASYSAAISDVSLLDLTFPGCRSVLFEDKSLL